MEPKAKCHICNSKENRYCCPKCNILYCSVECYRNPKHEQCSESFYKKLVHEELAFQNANQPPNKIYEILQRMQNHDFEDNFSENVEEDLDSDDQEDVDLATRLDGIDINNTTEIWKILTNEEKFEFEKMIENGDILNIVPKVIIWWEIKIESKLIEDLTKEPNKDIQLENPPVIDNITSFSKLFSKEPSPCLSYNLCNILGSYVCTYRFFRNEHHASALEATNYLIILSAALKTNSNFDTIEQAIKSVLFESTSESVPIATDDYLEIFKDVNNILEGPDSMHFNKLYILSALSDIHKLFGNTKKLKFGKNSQQSDNKDFSDKFLDFKVDNFDKNLTKVKLNQFIKKIEFYISFAKEKYIFNN